MLDDLLIEDKPRFLALEGSNGVAMELDGNPVGLYVVSVFHPTVRAKQHKIQNDRVSKVAKSSKAMVKSEQVEAENIDTLATCITGIQNLQVNSDELKEYFTKAGATFDDKNCLIYSHAAAVRLLKRFHGIRAQVDDFVGDESNFLKQTS
ncbi:MAG: hypothetical protein EBR82_10005 [Caulobacteraceae bacterium]|nr:hypothetical protein [Caulobacteraceae bacterium]